LALLLLASACSGGSPGDGKPPPIDADSHSHIVVVVMENREASDILGNPEAPFINSLARKYTRTSAYYAITHPSLPNYIALLGGSTFGITEDCDDCRASGPNLLDQLDHAGIRWKGYMEDLPNPCFLGVSSGRYAMRHDPFMYFPDIRTDPARCRRVVPYTELAADASSGSLPPFAFVAPNLCDDMHDCGIASGDTWLRSFMREVTPALGPTGVVVLTFDEGTTDSGCCEKAAGGNILTVVAGPGAERGQVVTESLDHYSLLRGIEEEWKLPLLGEAACPCTKPMPL
jgi:hypothetical protein